MRRRLCQLHRKRELQTLGEKIKFERRNFTSDIKKVTEDKQKCIEQLEQKATEYDSQMFHVEKQLMKK